MVTCPQGHHNPPGFDLCGQCGAPIEETQAEASAWLRTKWALVGAGTVVALVVLAASVVLAMDRGSDGSQAGSSAAAGSRSIPDWWATAHTPITDLRQALTDARSTLGRMDSAGLEDACERMHDLAGVDVHTYLPAPVPELTSELSAAADDAHSAAHMCLALAAGSQNTYSGEFTAGVEQAERRLVHAQELVNEALLRDR